MMTLKNIKISNILTPSQLINVKGGADNSCDTVKDDKRRDRPGGGITTL